MTKKELIEKIKEYKSYRKGWINLKKAYITYAEFVADNITYSEYVSEKLK